MEFFGRHRNPFLQLLEDAMQYKTYFIAVLVLGLVLGGGFYTYNVYRGNIEARAHSDFIDFLDYFDAKVTEGVKDKDALENAESFDTHEAKWLKVAQAFGDGYKKHKNSSLAPMFLAYESEALVNLGNLNEAISVLKKALELKLPNELQQLYLIKFALMQLDTAEGKESGLNLLTAFTDENKFVELVRKAGLSVSVNGNKNYVHDLALFRLGEYYWHDKQFELARNYWNQLLLKYGKDTKTPSNWSDQASNKLKLIESK